ncbi:nucleoside hydrolase [Paraherbaspirillum soli]|uniref:Nucleoside hydrolase n=1 Tax=Paraherbaspirillum soli TaxID=631222 RepID=A0ABW0MBZ9_9BURK
MKIIAILFAGVLGLAGCAEKTHSSAPQKVIIDSDYNTLGDDGQLGVMAAQLQAQGKIKVMGITVVSGNQWLKQGVADAVKAVERLGIADQVGVYGGSNYPLSHDLPTIQKELTQFSGGNGYLGAWRGPEPQSERDLKAPPDGFATHTAMNKQCAIEFIVDTVKANPHEVTILAVGPLTNIAIAVLQHPEIVPLIKQIIYMGGAINVPGNTTPTAEFNWWFDPEAAQIVLRQPIPHVVIPLDATNTVKLDKKTYDRITHDPAKQTAITKLFKQLNGYGDHGKSGFETDPKYTTNIWDTLTIAYLLDPQYATETVDQWVDVDTSFGANDGRSSGYPTEPQNGAPLQKVRIVKRFDNARFFDLYVDLLTRPVPVKLAQR